MRSAIEITTPPAPTREPIMLGEVFAGTLTSWGPVSMVRFTYRAARGDEFMQAEFDTREAFDIWMAAQVAAIYRKVFA